jgi:serine/threonine-protein kinase HipA
MHLGHDGGLLPATDLPFTHILKPAGTSGFEHMPVVEWLCLELGRIAGFTTAEAALIAMPDGMPPALVVERFDIRENGDDPRRLAMEDFCSILGVPAEDKYKGTIERMARAVRALSTDPAEDIATLFARAVFTWLIAGGDMHLKNVAMLKIAQPRTRAFESVRMAPLYDTLTKRVSPGVHDDHMALKLAGKDDRLRLTDFETCARTIDIPLRQARDIIDQLLTALGQSLELIELPRIVQKSASARETADAALRIVRSRHAALAAEQ